MAQRLQEDHRCELSIIIPAYQEGGHLAASILRIRECVLAVTGNYEILIVDDGSSDDTWDNVSRLCTQYKEIRGIRFSRNFGKDAALCAGLTHCGGAAAMILDADLQHPPQLITEFYTCWKEGYEVVEGVKSDRKDEPAWRRIASAAFNGVASYYTGIHFTNSTDFKLLDRKVIDAWLRFPERRVFFRGMVSWMGFRHKQIEFRVQPRTQGTSKWPMLSLLALALKATISFSSAPLRIAHLLSTTFTFFAIVLGGWSMYLKIVGKAVSGFTTVIIVLLIVGASTLMILGIIAEYIAAIYEELKGRPRYFVTEAFLGHDTSILNVRQAAASEDRDSRY